jgi:hypothetical protein
MVVEAHIGNDLRARAAAAAAAIIWADPAIGRGC